jgi:methyl coenzyme M reductase beta subunit
MIKNTILKELETLTNEGKFEELVNLYITTFLEVQPDRDRLRKIKKKVVTKLGARQEAFRKADLEKIKMRILNEELDLQINMIQNELTRTIILLVSYMVKHGHDDTTKEVFRWVKEHRHDPVNELISTIDKGLGSNPA